MNTKQIPVGSIEVPAKYDRPESRVRDDILRKSIAQLGIQQPLVVIETGKGKYRLVKGSRRLRFAKELDLPNVPAVIDVLPEGSNVEHHSDNLRFILDQCRQDLVPSQKAELVETLKRTFGLNNIQVAAYLGIDQDSVTNWLAVKKYIPEVVSAMDAGLVTMQAARVFDGMTEKGQKHIWRSHASDFAEKPGGQLHKELRKEYDPTQFKSFYVKPEQVASKLARKGSGRVSKSRPTAKANGISQAEKAKLLNSFEMKRLEVASGEHELKELQKDISAATKVVSAILRSEKLPGMIPKELREELSRFAEVYC